MLLDAAMTHCLFARRNVAVTAELCVRYRQAVVTGRPGRVRAWLVQSSPRLYHLRAELSQAGCVKAMATGKFLRLPKADVCGPSANFPVTEP